MLPILASGVVQGFALALAAVGFTIIYNASKVVNFAHGEFMLAGPYVGWYLGDAYGWPFLPAAAIGVLAGGAAGLVADRVVIGPLRGATMLTQVMGLLALSQVFQGVLRNTVGAEPINLPAYASLAPVIPGVQIAPMDIVIVVVTSVLILTIVVALYRTDLGYRVLAVADNAVGASLVGLNPGRIALVAWVLGGSVAALAGILVIPRGLLDLNIGFALTLNAFAAAVLGGFGSLSGAVIGGLLLGVLQGVVAKQIGGGYESIVTLLIMLVVLSVRPTGLVGERA